jgi:ribosomal protein S18 acetylase RimI-like enzyme
MGKPMIQIKTAGVEDAPLIVELSRRTFYDTFAQFNTAENMRIFQEEQFPREKQLAEVGAPGRIFLLAYADGEAVGYASMREAEPPQGLRDERALEIVQLYSDGKMIGKGVGSALMEACLDVARRQGKDWVWLGVWEQNQRAIAFYRKWGFERFGEHVFFVGLDAQTDWWMKKKLGE